MVRVQERGASNRNGTGFFVSPNLVLTAAHIVDDRGGRAGPIDLFDYNGTTLATGITPEIAKYADLALFRLSSNERPCVLFGGGLNIGDSVWSVGFVKRPKGFRLQPVLGQAEGDALTIQDDGQTDDHIKFSHGMIVPGMSGAPLINLASGLVCGIVVISTDPAGLAGGYAAPVRTILASFDNIAGPQSDYHRVHPDWRKFEVHLPNGQFTIKVKIDIVVTFPRGPGLRSFQIPDEIKDAIETLGDAAVDKLMSSANGLRVKAEGVKVESVSAITTGLPKAMQLGRDFFWVQAWPVIASMGPRYIASLIYSAPPGLFDGLDDIMLEFLSQLRAHSI